MTMKKELALLMFALAAAGALSGQFQANPLESFWSDPAWQSRFAASYGALHKGEPAVAEEEMAYFKDKVKPLLPLDVPGAAARLESFAGKPEAGPATRLTLANLYFQMGELNKAAAHYTRALDEFKDFTRAHRNLGILYMLQEKENKAAAHLSKAIALGDPEGSTYGLLGYLHYKNKRYLTAESALKQAIIYAPQNRNWEWLLAETLRHQGKYEEANLIIGKMLGQNPNNGLLWITQAKIHNGMETKASVMGMEKKSWYQDLDPYQKVWLAELEQSVCDLEIVSRLGADTLDTLMLRGDLFLKNGMPQIAVSAYLKVLKKTAEIRPEKPLKAAEQLLELGDLDAASRLLDAVEANLGAKLSPAEKKDLTTLKAIRAMAAGEGEKMISALEEVVRADPLNGPALITLGRYYGGHGEEERAVLMFERAGQLPEYRPKALIHHAKLRIQMKDWNRAYRLLSESQDLRYNENLEKYIAQVDQVRRAVAAAK